MRKVRTLGAVIAVAGLTVVSCTGGSSGSDGSKGDDGSATEVTADPSQADVQSASVPKPILATLSVEMADRLPEAIDRGTAFAAAHLDEVDPISLTYYDYLWRNWKAPGLDAARPAAQAGELPDDPQFSLFARLIDLSAPLEERPAGDAVSDLEYDVMARALHCDQKPLPDDWAQTVRTAVAGDAGPVVLTHAAYAVGWVRELGCPVAGIEELAQELVGSLVNQQDGAISVDDDGVQIGVGLVYLGRPDLITEAWLGLLLDAQLEDGGWPAQTGSQESSWHTTGLALWTLYGVQSAGTGAPMLLVE